VTIPGLVYLGNLAGQFSLGEIAAANLAAGLAIIALGLLGGGARILQWNPLPIVMGMFSGSSLDYLTRLVGSTIQDVALRASSTSRTSWFRRSSPGTSSHSCATASEGEPPSPWRPAFFNALLPVRGLQTVSHNPRGESGHDEF